MARFKCTSQQRTRVRLLSAEPCARGSSCSEKRGTLGLCRILQVWKQLYSCFSRSAQALAGPPKVELTVRAALKIARHVVRPNGLLSALSSADTSSFPVTVRFVRPLGTHKHLVAERLITSTKLPATALSVSCPASALRAIAERSSPSRGYVHTKLVSKRSIDRMRSCRMTPRSLCISPQPWATRLA